MKLVQFFLYICLFVFFTIKMQAQPFEVLYGLNYGDEFTSVLRLHDGTYMISGSAYSIDGYGGKDIYIIRFDTSHNVIWSRIYGSNFDDAAYASLVNNNGNIILACSSYGNSAGANSDIVIMEIDLLGNMLWKKVFIIDGYDEIPRKIIRTPNGLAVCAISNESGTTASPKMLVFEIDGTCNSFYWKNIISSTEQSGDIPSSIINNSIGGFIMVGATKSSATNYDQVVFRLSNTGLIQSHVAFGSPLNENTQDVIELPNKDLILLSNFRDLTGSGLEMALVSLKEDNTFNWIKTYGDHGVKDDRPYAFKRGINGDYFIAGFSYMYGSGDKDLMILRTDQNGKLLNANNYGGDGDEQPWDMSIYRNELLVVGSTSSFTDEYNGAYILRRNIDVTSNDCFAVEVVEDSLTLITNSFSYNQNNPNISIDTVSFNTKEMTLISHVIDNKKKINGNINDVFTQASSDILNIQIGLRDGLNRFVKPLSILEASQNFKLLIPDNNDLVIQGLINTTSSSHLLLKYRNGFDAFQMENIITNNIGAPLQIDPNPYAMVAADVDLNDKIRANDITHLQEVIVRKTEGFPQQLPAELNRKYIDWRFIDKTTVDHSDAFKKANNYPYYNDKGYCRDNVPDIPYFLSNQGSCDTNFVETYSAILLGDLVYGGSGVDYNSFNDQSSKITLDIDDVHDLGYSTYRVFLNHTLNPQDKFVSLDFALDYDEANISIADTKMTVENKMANPQWLSNDYNASELLFTSYSMNGYPLSGNLMYIDIQKSSGTPTIEDLGQMHLFVNGTEVPTAVRLRSQTSTGIDISKDVRDFVNLYPNPTDDKLTISLPLVYAKDVHIEFINTIGESVMALDQSQTSSDIELDLSSLSSGLYNCLIQIQGKATIIKKVIVK